jgi:RNA-directed DNA polymerase
VKAAERQFLEQHGTYRYHVVEIPKRSGGHRRLLVPEKRLKSVQRALLTMLEPLQVVRNPVHGFVKGRGAISNANAHQNRPFLLNLDLQNFFGSITRRRVRGVLEAIGLPSDTVEAVCVLCVVANQLPQGAPTSPILANMVSFRLDSALMRFAADHRMRYTRFADDISFSSYSAPLELFHDAIQPPAGKLTEELLALELRMVIRANGFAIHPSKIWYSNTLSRKEVTGLVVNEFTNVKRTFVRDLRAGIFKAETMGIAAAEADLQNRYDTTAPLQSVLRGRLEWVGHVRGRSFGAYRTLARRYNKLFPDHAAPIDPTFDELAEGATWVVEFLSNTDCDQGTAFFLRGLGLVTADHVLAKLPAGLAADIYRPSAPTKVYQAVPTLRRCPTRDLLILSHNIPASEHFDLPAATSPLRSKDSVIALGFPDFAPSDSLSQRPGHLVARTVRSGVRLLEVSPILPNGISGGPIVNDRYEVVGISQKGGLDEPRQLAVDLAELSAL